MCIATHRYWGAQYTAARASAGAAIITAFGHNVVQAIESGVVTSQARKKIIQHLMFLVLQHTQNPKSFEGSNQY